MSRFLEEAKKLIRINSVTERGNEELVNYISSLLQDRGLKINVQQITHTQDELSKRQFNVIGILGDPLVERKIKRGLLFLNHLDTSDPGHSALWTETGGDPFALKMDGNKIYGLGVADAKLDFLCKLTAISKFREKKLKSPIYLVGSCGGKAGMFGTKYLLQSLALNPKMALVGMPSLMKLVTSQKSETVLKVSISYPKKEKDARGFNRRVNLSVIGKSGHSAYPKAGQSAIELLTLFLQNAIDSGFDLQFHSIDGGQSYSQIPDRAKTTFFLTSHQFEDFKRFFKQVLKTKDWENSFQLELGGLGDMGISFLPDDLFPCFSELSYFMQTISANFEKNWDESFDPPTSTLTLTKMKQNAAITELYFDLRVLPSQSTKQTIELVQAGVKEVAKSYPSFNLASQVVHSIAEVDASGDSDWLKTCEEALVASDLKAVRKNASISSEMSLLAQKGIEVFGFGPGGSASNIHAPNESNLMDDLEKTITFYEKIIERVCL